MKVGGLCSARRVSPARALTRREKQAIDYITACGWEARAFSVSFSVTRSCVKGLIYYDKIEMRRKDAMERGERDEQDKCAPQHTHV